MTVSKLSICNAALIEIGGQMIASMTEDSEPARLCNYLFDDLLDQELQLENWSFATARAALSVNIDDPPFGWTYQFNLPDEPYCLHVMSEYNDNEFKIEGRKLLSDSKTIQIIFIKRVTNLDELPPLFRRAFTYKLASLLSVPLQGSRALKEGMEALYDLWYRRAAFRDAQGSGTPPEQDEGSWIEAKFS